MIYKSISHTNIEHWGVLQWTVAEKDFDLDATPGTAIVSKPFEASGYP